MRGMGAPYTNPEQRCVRIEAGSKADGGGMEQALLYAYTGPYDAEACATVTCPYFQLTSSILMLKYIGCTRWYFAAHPKIANTEVCE